ncbi:MAG: hypothetical protein DRQ55_12385 [Planctomycetota bacterium]|nr:MAG: hypothetical protein DRQ55_12385 [Planctomycetota bacterium]
MNVLFLSPGFPDEMPRFVQALAECGARVIGVGEHHKDSLPEPMRAAMAAYLKVDSIMNEGEVIATVQAEVARAGVRIDRVESLWEPLMLLAARLREVLGVPGMSVDQTQPFRDKGVMKQVLDAAGIRTPHHARAASGEEIRAAAARIGYPLIVKPIDGAGAADTYRVDGPEQLEDIIGAVTHVPEVSVEEFIEGEEFTFDTICARGEVLFYNICWYRPRPLIARTVEWMDSQTISLRNPDDGFVAAGKAMGFEVIKALGYQDGFTHMEWFRLPSGEAVFGEIAARPPGAFTVETMSFAADTNCYSRWAEAICFGQFRAQVQRRYNCSCIFKRARGQGRISAVHGLDSFLTRFGEHVVRVDLLPVGAQRRNWKATLLSDGHVMLRHPDLQAALEMSDAFGSDVRMDAE